MTTETETHKATTAVKEVTLKAPQGHKDAAPVLIIAGEQKFPGDKVTLRPDQIERFKDRIK